MLRSWSLGVLLCIVYLITSYSRVDMPSFSEVWLADPRQLMHGQADDSTYLAFHGAGGLTNQRLCFISGLIAAATEKYTLVLPSWHERQFDMSKTMVTDGTIYPFEHFYRIEAFRDFATYYNFSIVTHLPSLKSQACIAQLSAVDDALLTREITQSWADRFGVICMTPGNMFFQGKSLWDAQKVPAGLWGTIMEAFQPAPKFEALLDEAMTSIPGQYITVHVRIEEDANKYCQEEEESHVEWKGRRCALSEIDYHAYLITSGVPVGSSLYIASGVELSDLQTLCSDFQCFDQVSLVGFEKLSYMEKAFFDFSMATQGEEFYGSLSSTFSTQLYDMFRADRRRTAFVNPYCDNGQLYCG